MSFPCTDRRSPSKDVISLLKQGFVQSANAREYRATALVYGDQVKLPTSGEKSDAIAVSLNHRENYSVIVFFPYLLKNSQLVFGEVFSQKREADVFPSK